MYFGSRMAALLSTESHVLDPTGALNYSVTNPETLVQLNRNPLGNRYGEMDAYANRTPGHAKLIPNVDVASAGEAS